MLKPGDIVTLDIAFVSDYAVWGRTPRGELGMVPLDGDPDDLDPPELPEVGQTLRVCVSTLLDPVGQEQHSDVTFDGRIRRVAFLASLVETSEWE